MAAPTASAATGKWAPSVAAKQRRAGVVEDTVAITILKTLGLGAVTKGGAETFGYVLQAFGLGEGMTSGKLDSIRTELTEIKDSLKQVQEATSQLRSEVAKEGYDDVTQQAIGVTSSVTTGMEKLEEVTRLPNDDPTKKNLAAKALKYIEDNLMGKQQEELANRITGQGGGSGLIIDASRVTRSLTTYWTDATSKEVRDVFDFYQGMEAQLLLLRVEYMNCHPKTYSKATIENETKEVEQQIKEQNNLLKASPPPGTLVDTRTNQLFDFNEIDKSFKFKEAENRYATDKAPCDDCWKIASRAAVSAMLGNWTGPTWLEWLNKETRGAIAPLSRSGFKGVWFGLVCPDSAAEATAHGLAYGCETNVLTSNAVKRIIVTVSPPYLNRPIAPDEGYGYVLEKPRTEEYWW